MAIIALAEQDSLALTVKLTSMSVPPIHVSTKALALMMWLDISAIVCFLTLVITVKSF